MVFLTIAEKGIWRKKSFCNLPSFLLISNWHKFTFGYRITARRKHIVLWFDIKWFSYVYILMLYILSTLLYCYKYDDRRRNFFFVCTFWIQHLTPLRLLNVCCLSSVKHTRTLLYVIVWRRISHKNLVFVFAMTRWMKGLRNGYKHFIHACCMENHFTNFLFTVLIGVKMFSFWMEVRMSVLFYVQHKFPSDENALWMLN